MNTEVKVIAPMLPVAEMQATVDFYVNVLGFSVLMQVENYAVIARDGAEVHLTLAEAGVLEAVRGKQSIYMRVENIESLWQQVDSQRADYRVKELFEQPYGMREFHIEDPNDCLVFVGESLV